MADTTLLQFSKSKLQVPVIGWKLKTALTVVFSTSFDLVGFTSID